MKNITLTTNNNTGKEIIVNWDNVEFAKATVSPYGDEYVEIHFAGQYIDVRESLKEIHKKCLHALN